ncbi:MAG TPA: cytochrome c oxidase subunit II [Dermatophilaceae bacterium]|jgi:cytochrome c oxidase subunit 2
MAQTESVTAQIRTWWQRVEIKRIVWIWLGITVVLVIFALMVPARVMGPAASPSMRAVESTMTIFSVAAAPVMALVLAVAVYSLIVWRSRGSEPPIGDGPPIRGNGLATATWIVASSLLTMFVLIWGLGEMQSLSAEASGPNAMVVNVTGQQWVWTFSYPQNGNVESDQLYLPVNRPVVFHVTSKDVVHSFWVVELGIKVDANPGEMTKSGVIPDKRGTYVVRCAELCGLLHAHMETQAHVVNSADFSAWITAQGGRAS